LNKAKTKGFTLIEVLVALAILGFVLSASLKIFFSNSFAVATLEQKTLASFVAENILVQTFSFNNELVYAKGTQSQGGLTFEWERNIIFDEDGKSAQINIVISSEKIKDVYQLSSYKAIH
tara:strand:- start:4337 stop:4696 length:360 start_codon:yes stop_codon:yes gene_type:complete